MNAEIITSGTELLLGSIVDTNSAWLSRRLAEAGINIYYRTTVGDNAGRFLSALETATKRADVIIITGGLGPTVDDLTRVLVSEFTGKKLVRHQHLADFINEMFRKTGRTAPSVNQVQADIPEGALILENNLGSAPGFILDHKGKIIVAMPGVPREMKPMFELQALPYLKSKNTESGGASCIKFTEMRIAGMSESLVNEKIEDLFVSSVNPSIGIMCRQEEIIVRVTASARNATEADSMIGQLKSKVASRLGGFYYADEPDTLENILGSMLRQKNMTLSTAESCTSGMVAAKITEPAGSSAYYKGGINAYSNEVKTAMLGVPEEILSRHGAVSSECALKMAEGCAEKFGTDAAVAVTGIAGPGGGSSEKPVGLVFTAVKVKNETRVFRNVYTGTRDIVRQRAAFNAIFMLVRMLKGD